MFAQPDVAESQTFRIETFGKHLKVIVQVK